MKTLHKLIVVAFLGTFLFGCSKETEIENDSTFSGTWQLVQIYSNPGAGPGNWSDVQNGYTYTFSSKGNFFSTRFRECTSGSFSSESNLLTLNYGCDGFTTKAERPDGTFVEEFTFESGFLILKPTYLTCIEGCGLKFKKISN